MKTVKLHAVKYIKKGFIFESEEVKIFLDTGAAHDFCEELREAHGGDIGFEDPYIIDAFCSDELSEVLNDVAAQGLILLPEDE